MTEAQILALIQQVIIANGNNEITADVLRPVLVEMLQQPNQLIGDLGDLQTNDKTNLVNAINEVLGTSSSGIVILNGSTNPNVTPPTGSYEVGNFYTWNDGVLKGFFQYNGNEWVLIENIESVNLVSSDVGNGIGVGSDGKLFASKFSESIPIENTYLTIDGVGGMLDSQVNQSTGFIQKVLDASFAGVPGIAYFEKKASSTADLSDYDRITDSPIDLTEYTKSGGSTMTTQQVYDSIVTSGRSSTKIPNAGSVLPLNNPLGNLCNFGTANTNTTYTIGPSPVLNGYDKVLIKTLTKPTITGATPIGNDIWKSDTLMYMVANYTGSERGVEYFFLDIVATVKPQLKEEEIKGSAKIALTATGAQTLNFDNYAHGHFNLTAAGSLTITDPILAVGESVVRSFKVKNNGFDFTIPTRISDKMDDVIDVDMENTITINYVQLAVGNQDLTVFIHKI